MKEPLPVIQLLQPGRTPYDESWQQQRTIAQLRSAGAAPDTLILTEHPHTYTLGRATQTGHLLAGADTLAAQGVTVREVDRGGDITYHGPGQIVGYPILKLSRYGSDVWRYLRMLEDVVIETIGAYGISGTRIDGLTGVWVGDAKIAAIGIKLTAGGVTMHGFALNVAPDLCFFSQIIPCGIRGRAVTSLEQLLGAAPPQSDILELLIGAFERIFGVEIRQPAVSRQ
jgi:lipoyl(octanoyl) transferase